MSRRERGLFLVRRPNGRMMSIEAYSPRGAVKALSTKRDLPCGVYDVKRRGEGEWESYSIR